MHSRIDNKKERGVFMPRLKTTVTIYTELNHQMPCERAEEVVSLFFSKLNRSTNVARSAIRVDPASVHHTEEDLPFDEDEEA